MSFQDNLSTIPDISHLTGLDICDEQGNVVQHIPAVAGKLGSLKLYSALAQEFAGKLNQEAADRGLVLFAEHVADAEKNPGKHPNIDLLFRVQRENLTLLLKPLTN